MWYESGRVLDSMTDSMWFVPLFSIQKVSTIKHNWINHTKHTEIYKL